VAGYNCNVPDARCTTSSPINWSAAQSSITIRGIAVGGANGSSWSFVDGKDIGDVMFVDGYRGTLVYLYFVLSTAHT